MVPRKYIRFDDCRTPAASPPGSSLKWRDAPYYQPTRELKLVLELAMALGQPLIITGPPGSGKTSAAYWAAWRLGLSPKEIIHVQVNSESEASSLRYQFDAIGYFREAQVSAARGESEEPSKVPYVMDGPLWRAFQPDPAKSKLGMSSSGGTNPVNPVVLLFDEIDKAPPQFPNDLLHELDAFEFDVVELPDPETRQPPLKVRRSPEREGGFLCVITSNEERSLPDPFLRRCLHHHLDFDLDILGKAVERRLGDGNLRLAPNLVSLALERFKELRNVQGLSHRPAYSEFYAWLKALEFSGTSFETLKVAKLAELHAGTMIKNAADLEVVRQRYR
ncbi:MAG: MoxR family ATPase [Polyangiaceae bacterium]|jgi:MoxR-like ATPase